ncbi:Sec61 beta subunit [Tubulinosema ratisbonensis]|uniref:Sec61 beta subunit n=1 Tax=Tubulinosema ratisbonensis TaxID=291195 RepID=A0A437AHW0_9MICR|nr:Sec61 beta subunit [Tubulinosema ratisbonensis]
MKKIEVKKHVPSQTKNKREIINKLLSDELKPIQLTPVHVLIISLLFMANVFLLHLYSKFGSSSSSLQIVFAMLMVLLSLFFGLSLNKKAC